MLNKNNCYIIVPPSGKYPEKLYNSIRNIGYDVGRSMAGKGNPVFRFLRSYLMRYEYSAKLLFYGEWFKIDLAKYPNILIIFDKYSYIVIDVIRNRKSYKGNIYLYYMDPVDSNGGTNCRIINIESEITNNRIMVYSFEKRDCEKYKFYYNSLFLFKEDLTEAKENSCDVLFIGTDKGRLEKLLYLESILTDVGLKCDIHVCKSGDGNKGYAKKVRYKYKKRVSYDELIYRTMRARCILEVVPENQKEITLRVIEALFFKKKVITNNVGVTKYDFYDRNNIFIMGEDSESELKAFVMGEFIESEKTESIKNMDFERWIERFV